MEGDPSDLELQTTRAERLKDRFRLSVVAVAEAEAQKSQMVVSQPVMTALAELTFKFAEQLAIDLEMFAHHAGRKSINIDDVFLAARRNADLAETLTPFVRSLKKCKEKGQGKKRKRLVPKSE